jgi:Spy/CpxP family protein refolding chaperone
MIRKILALSIVALSPLAWSADAGDPKETQPSPEQAVAAFRADLMAKRSDVMAKSLTLTSEQAAKFWPLFEEFQKEQGQIVEGQLKATKQYGEHLQDLSDSDALAYVKSLLARDAKMNELQVKWLTKFQTVVPAKTAARAIQIDRRLGHVTQVGLSSQIPLVR